MNGASGRKYFPETMGPGVAFLDYDGDQDLDIYLVNGPGLPGYKAVHKDGCVNLYVVNDAVRNNGDGTFAEIGAVAGVAYGDHGHKEAGMGVDAVDYDNDGHMDLVVTIRTGAHRSASQREERFFRECFFQLRCGAGQPEVRTSLSGRPL